MKQTLLILFTFLSIGCFAQFSKTHYIPPITAQNNLAEDQYIYISTPSTSDIEVKIIEIGGNVNTKFINKNDPWVHPIGSGNNTQLFTPKTSIGPISNKGYIIEADDLVYVSVRVNSGRTTTGTYNHAGGLVSKGNSALGKEFRLGAMLNPLFDTSLLNFASILSTENATRVTISNIPNGTILSDGTPINGPINVLLNKNESYVLAFENTGNTTTSNSSKMIGALVIADKPVVVNSGSFGGSNSTIVSTSSSGVTSPTGRDVGFDQIVPFEKTGKEYIFVKGIGTNELERVLLISNKPNTVVYINDILTPYSTIVNAGDYLVFDGSQFIDGNLYVTTSENVFSYQSIGGLAPGFLPNGSPNNPPANQNLFFVPPINCATPNSVDNIPSIQSIGNNLFNGGLNIVTEKGATVNVYQNGILISASSATGITGNPGFERYSISGLTGNISVKSTRQVYVSYYGTNGAATYGGYYSGFDTKPEIVTDKISISNSACIPNVVLKINTLSSYDSFQWYFNDVAIDPIQHPDAITNTYTPTTPGYYHVQGAISGCPSNGFVSSDKIPVSECPTNQDNDLANDNIDIDNDNDGITNCTESYGNQIINISNTAIGTIAVGTYSNSFTGTITTSGTGTPGTITGNSDGSFTTEIPAGKDNSITYKMTFTQPLTAGIEYSTTANAVDLFNADTDYIINTDTNKTITVLNPNNQLLIDTNYDGIYETGVTEYSSFEIRFRLNSTTPLVGGTGTFKFLSYLANSISITHKNLSETNPNRSTLKFYATCVPKDSDGDGIPDQLDLDSDNDGIPDIIEAQVNSSVALSNTDTNKNGLDNAFEPGFTPIDTDNDGIPDFLDLDSDNDGIYDATETGSLATDTDGDGIKDYRELDSDNDGCNDVIEAGFTDSNSDGILGSITPPTVDSKGIVTSRTNGYTAPNANYTIAAPIIINTQPIVPPTCELQNTTIKIVDNGGNNYQWQLSIDGNSWNPITPNTVYSGTATNTLNISSVTNTMNNYKYRVLLNQPGNSCDLLSSEATLTVYGLPTVSNSITLVQCDDDGDGISNFNLTEKNSFISANHLVETFTYYTSENGANTKDDLVQITDPFAYISPSSSIWTRVENQNGCYRISQLNLIVSSTQIPTTFKSTFSSCDDFLDNINDDKDGISTFDFSSVTNEIKSSFLSSSTLYEIKYYRNEADALSERNEITNTSNYRNIGYPNQQQIWVRVESTLDNACYGLGPHVTLTVNAKPNINTNEDHSEDELVCSNLPTFFVRLDSGIEDGTPASNYTYQWTKDDVILTTETKEFLNVNAVGIYTVSVSNLFGCSRIRTIKVTASDIATIDSIDIIDLADNNTVTINVTGQGDYEYNLDDPTSSFQPSNVFENVIAGIHEVYINDKNGCGKVQKTVAVIGVPRFFTPNNDGYNDYWNLKGVNNDLNSKSVIYIFDRYGKLLKELKPNSLGWNGTFNGAPLPADDYWYTIKLEDNRELKGHFSLKR